jgi:hypothetical protein
VKTWRPSAAASGDIRQVVERAKANAPEFLHRGLRRTNGREERAATES